MTPREWLEATLDAAPAMPDRIAHRLSGLLFAGEVADHADA